MAVKQITKKAKKAIEIKTIDQLKADLLTSQTDLIEARRGNKLGELTNPHIITETRKKIARIHSAISALQIANLAVTVKPVAEKGDK